MKKILIFTICFLLGVSSSFVSAAESRGFARPSSAVKNENNSGGGRRESRPSAAPSRPSSSAPKQQPAQQYQDTAQVQSSQPRVVQTQGARQRPSSKPAVSRPVKNQQNVNNGARRGNRQPQRQVSNVVSRAAYQPAKVTRIHNRGVDVRPVSKVSVAASASNANVHIAGRMSSSSGHNNTARTIATLLFFPFSLSLWGNSHSRHSIYVSRPYYHYSYYDPYYYSRLYYSPYWWQDSTNVNYNTYNNYTYVQNENNAPSQIVETSQDSIEGGFDNIKLQGARYIDSPQSVALTVTNENKYAIAGIVFTFVFRGSDFTEVVEDVSYDFQTALAQYEKRFMRVDLSGVDFQTPQSFSVVPVIQSIVTEDGQVITANQQNVSY